MKLRFYLDIWPGSTTHTQSGYIATTCPGQRFGQKRFAFDIHIPDELVHDVNHFVPEVGKVELVPDQRVVTVHKPRAQGKTEALVETAHVLRPALRAPSASAPPCRRPESAAHSAEEA